jgi:hypothetical protein
MMHELCTYYFLESQDSGSAMLVSRSQTCQIPKCSLTRFATGVSNAGEKGQSGKYANSKLRIQRKATSGSDPSTAAGGVVLASHGGRETGQLSCSVSLAQKAHSKNSFGVLQLDEDSGDGAASSIEPSDMCCICLEPLLSLPRALKGETVSALKCGHVLHTACATGVLVSGSSTDSGGVGVVHNFKVGEAGTVVPDLGPIKCPQCRSDTHHMDKIQYVVSTQDGTVVPVEKKDCPSQSKAARGKRSNKKKGEWDVPLGEGAVEEKNAGGGESEGPSGLSVLMGMGFDEAAAQTALEGTGGNTDRAIELLVG